MSDNDSAKVVNNDQIIEDCLRVFHGDGSYGWSLIKQQWPHVAIEEQRRKMRRVIAIAQSSMRNEVFRLSGCLLAISGAVDCGNGSLKTAAYEAAAMGAKPEELAVKLNLPAPLRKQSDERQSNGDR